MNKVEIRKAFNNRIERAKSMYPAAGTYEAMDAGYETSFSLLDEYKEIGQICNGLVEHALNHTEFEDEFIFGRPSNAFYIGADPYWDQIWKLFHIINDNIEKFPEVFGAEDILQRFIVLMRNRILLKKWNRYRKAYVFDRELEKVMLEMKGIVIPSCIVDVLPYQTVYFEFPKNSAISDRYEGVYADIHRSHNMTQINNEIGNMVERIRNQFAHRDPDKTKTVLVGDQEITFDDYIDMMTKHYEEDKAYMSAKEYVTFNVIMINKSTDEMGIHTPYTFMLPLAVGEDGNCRVDEKYLENRLKRDDFDAYDQAQKIVKFVLNGMMYLGAKNADIVLHQEEFKTIVKNRNGKKKTQTNDAYTVEVGVCGAEYGEEVRAYERYLKNLEQIKEKGLESPRDYPDSESEYEYHSGRALDGCRRPRKPFATPAHYQRYHVGKGRTDVRWILTKPGFFNGISKKSRKKEA